MALELDSVSTLFIAIGIFSILIIIFLILFLKHKFHHLNKRFEQKKISEHEHKHSLKAENIHTVTVKKIIDEITFIIGIIAIILGFFMGNLFILLVGVVISFISIGILILTANSEKYRFLMHNQKILQVSSKGKESKIKILPKKNCQKKT